MAPESNAEGGWDPKIYERPLVLQTLGNLVLLPQKENSSVGNAPWQKKKLFYAALRAESKGERESLIMEAEKEGFRFTNRTKDLLDQQEQLHMLDSLADVGEWTETLIRKRSENILALAWDRIAPWLGMP